MINFNPAGPFRVIDISQSINSNTACFPGDVPFSKQVTVSWEQSKVINLTAITMSPHVGTHADAPIHIYGDLQGQSGTAGLMSLQGFLGPACVIDISPFEQAIPAAVVLDKLPAMEPIPPRILLRTRKQVHFDKFEKNYASLSVELVNALADKGVVLIGIDCPSVDPVDSKGLPVHHALMSKNMVWLENLDLTDAAPGNYFLIALPLKFTELEASPVRAVLLTADQK